MFTRRKNNLPLSLRYSLSFLCAILGLLVTELLLNSGLSGIFFLPEFPLRHRTDGGVETIELGNHRLVEFRNGCPDSTHLREVLLDPSKKTVEQVVIRGGSLDQSQINVLFGEAQLGSLTIVDANIRGTVSGSDPSTLAPTIVWLDLSGSRFTAPSSVDFSAVPSVEFLFLRDVNVGDPAFSSMKDLKHLYALFASGTDLNSATLSLAGCTELRSLNLERVNVPDDDVRRLQEHIPNLNVYR